MSQEKEQARQVQQIIREQAQGNTKLADMHWRRSRRCKGGPTRYLWLSGESG